MTLVSAILLLAALLAVPDMKNAVFAGGKDDDDDDDDKDKKSHGCEKRKSPRKITSHKILSHCMLLYSISIKA